jgi:hypothetical protein
MNCLFTPVSLISKTVKKENTVSIGNNMIILLAGDLHYNTKQFQWLEEQKDKL